MLKKPKIFLILISLLFIAFSENYLAFSSTHAMPFYNLKPSELVLRASFYTSFSTSTPERKHNIFLAAKSINNTLLSPNEEFSFNKIVGERTEKRGYKQSKIILNGEFVDGVGGGVCQVSSTLYNAALIAGLKITEYHPHSLAVSYVAPSFDAMVNSNCADLRFINNTHNPIIIYSKADDSTIKFEIYGEKMQEKLVRKSIIVKEIACESPEIILDEKGEFPDLYIGESKILRYGKNGIKSEGFLLTIIDDKVVKTKKIRTDTYLAVRGKIILGTAINDEEKTEILPPSSPDLS